MSLCCCGSGLLWRDMQQGCLTCIELNRPSKLPQQPQCLMSWCSEAVTYIAHVCLSLPANEDEARKDSTLANALCQQHVKH